MRILQIDKLPDLAQRKEWAQVLGCNYTTLQRAEWRGLIQPLKPNGYTVHYTKETILKWLGLPQNEISESAKGE